MMIRRPTPGARTARALTRTRDGFDNLSARLGLGQDNMLARSGYTPGARLTQTTLEDMYRTSWVVARMVEVVAEDMVRSGVDLQVQMPPDKIDALMKSFRGTGIPGRITDAIKWGRLYGGAIAVLLIDGHDLAAPLELETVQKNSFRGLYVLDRHTVTPSTALIEELGPMFGYPAYYTVNQAGGLRGQRIHNSRVLRFVGVVLPYNQRLGEQHWGGSVVERAYDRILALDSATHGAANLMFKSFLRVIGIENYRQILAAGGKAEAALHKMLTLIRQLQSNEGLTVLDKNDQFYTTGYTFAGVYDALQAFAEQIGGATGIPLVRLLGQSPKGFSTGESDLRIYYDTIATACEDDLRAPYTRLFSVQSRHLWGESLSDDFTFEFRSLYLPTELEKSQIATADAQAVSGLHQVGLLTQDMALAELRDAGRVTGRFAGITDEAIEAAKTAAAAPALPEGMPNIAPETEHVDPAA